MSVYLHVALCTNACCCWSAKTTTTTITKTKQKTKTNKQTNRQKTNKKQQQNIYQLRMELIFAFKLFRYLIFPFFQGALLEKENRCFYTLQLLFSRNIKCVGISARKASLVCTARNSVRKGPVQWRVCNSGTEY